MGKTYKSKLRRNNKLITNISGKKLKAFHLRSCTRPSCPLSPPLLTVDLEILTQQSSKKKKSKASELEKKLKLLLFADDMKITQKVLRKLDNHMQKKKKESGSIISHHIQKLVQMDERPLG